MKRIFLVVLIALLGITPLLAQSGRYGLTSWAINNQRVASQFNFDIDSRASSGLGQYVFPQSVCTNALNLSGRQLNPLNTNATIKIVDQIAANTETVALTSFTIANGYCTLVPNTVTAHSRYNIRSGTCGLREALNDLQGKGGEVIVDQKFYDDGCTAATISGITLASGLKPNQYIRDISSGQEVFYVVKPTTVTPKAAPAAPSGVAGGTTGTWTTGNTLVSVTYVDAIGGETVASDETTVAMTTGTANVLTVTSPAASAGAVGYRVYTTAIGGSSLSGILNNGTCTLISPELPSGPACALGSSAVVSGPATATSKIPSIATAHASFAYAPVHALPVYSPAAGSGVFQTNFPPSTVGVAGAVPGTVNNSSEDLAVMTLPAGYLNVLGKVWEVCAKISTGTQVAASVPVIKLNASTKYLQSPVTISTITLPTQTQAAAGTIQGCWLISTSATGSSGTLSSMTSAPWANALNSAPGTLVQAVDVTTAASSAIDLTKVVYLSLNFGESASHDITTPVAKMFVLKPIAGN